MFPVFQFPDQSQGAATVVGPGRECAPNFHLTKQTLLTLAESTWFEENRT